MNKLNEMTIQNNTDGIIKQYVESSVIGKKVLDEFVKLYNEDKGYYLGDMTPKYGLITNLVAIDTLITASDFNVSLEEFHPMLLKLFKLVYEKICKNGTFIFDASPYMENDDKINIDMFIETISKSIIVMCDFREYLRNNPIRVFDDYNLNGIKIKNNEELIIRIEEILIQSIKYINASCLKNPEQMEYSINGRIVKRGELSPQIAYRGWTFEKIKKDDDDYGISLYFTFHATNAFLYVYQAFEKLFNEKYDNVAITDILKPEEKDLLEKDRKFFNDNFKILDEYRTKVISTGRYVEMIINRNEINIANDYINKDIMPISDKKILDTERSNDVLNTLFAIGIMTNAGLDDDYNSIGQLSTFQEQIQFGINNVKKMFLLLKKNNKEDSIETYHLLFNEKCPKERISDMQEYRKRCDEVITYDYVPLFCSIYYTVFQYLIKFPQIEMHEILDLVLQNSAKDKWLWTSYGFEINNNLYYYYCLKTFYDYYNEYELPLSKAGEVYNEKATRANEELQKKSDLLKEKIDEYNELKKQFEEKQSALDKEVYEIAKLACEKTIESSIRDYLNDMIDECKSLMLTIYKNKSQNSSYNVKEALLMFPKAQTLLEMLSSFEYKDSITELGDAIYNSDKNIVNNKFNSKIINRILNKLEK